MNCVEIHNLFYTPPEKIRNKLILIEGTEFHHLKNVLKKNIAEIIFLTDGKGYQYKAKISQIEKFTIKADILNKNYIQKNSNLNLDLAFVPLKGMRNDYIIEKGTELGVRKILPFVSNFSVIKNLNPAKIERFKKIAISAMLQSQRYRRPEIIFQKKIVSLLEYSGDYDLVLLADKKEGDREIPLGAKSILYIVGPEGGFNSSEILLLKKSGAKLISLGPNRLRSETAAIIGVVKILTAYKEI